ncbi:MAG: hypothetical protein MUP11_07190 [Anaerolineales bacterium]|nr:hypothetical protein [Anaerolineales bacterium]
MTKISKLSFRILLSAAIIFTSLASAVGVGYAQEGGEGMTITGTADVQCGEVQFTFNWSGGPAPYLFRLDFGDGNSTGIVEVSDSTYTTSHIYFNQGNYALDVEVAEKAEGGLSGIYSEILPIIIPDVTLSSVPFPPLFVVGDPGLVDFSTLVTGGTPPYTYAWALVGDGSFDTVTGDIASSTYSEVGKYKPLVLVTDANNCTATDTMPVVVADPEDACQPTAQKIADGVNTLFPDQSGDLYTCEDIYGIFDNEGDENNIGFGQMWKAYNLALSMEELSWEEILDWKLNESGWGALLQLDRFAELLDEDKHSLPDLMLLVMSEEYSLGDVRTAVRSVIRYEADFEDALTRIAEGATAGELSQAYKLASDEVTAAEILIMGVQEYKETQRIKTKTEQQEQKAELQEQKTQQQEEKQQQTAERLAEQFSAEFGEVMNLYNGECEGEWSCVRASLNEQQRSIAQGFSEKDYQNALQISSKYGSTQEEVLAYHQDFCGEDWTCTRSYFRNMHTETKETGKPNK